MNRKIDLPYLLHIRDAIALIQKWSKDKTFDDFVSDDKLQSAIIRQMEIIGEAARNVSRERKVAAPEIPWRPIMDARNTLIHGYFSVDQKKVWGMVMEDIPKLKNEIQQLVTNLQERNQTRT